MNVILEAVTVDNFEALMDMELPPEQARCLASNACSIGGLGEMVAEIVVEQRLR